MGVGVVVWGGYACRARVEARWVQEQAFQEVRLAGSNKKARPEVERMCWQAVLLHSWKEQPGRKGGWGSVVGLL